MLFIITNRNRQVIQLLQTEPQIEPAHRTLSLIPTLLTLPVAVCGRL